MGCLRQRGLPEPARPGLYGRLGGAARGDPAIARPAAVGQRAHGDGAADSRHRPNFEEPDDAAGFPLAKSVRIGQRVRVQGNFDLYNAFNSSSVLATTSAYGARWLVPTLILEPRILQFSAQLTF